ncbi:MAG: primosomal protein N' [Clostridia bacterium]|nr:primosomal protein N' [Clostridia bacterium]
MLYARVHILNAPYHIDKPYTYSLPAQLENKVSVGSVVVVPFGGANKQRCGVVTELTNNTDYSVTKPVLGVPGKYMHVGSEMLEMCKFMKEHLFCSLGDAASCALPSGLGVKSVRYYKRITHSLPEGHGLNNSSLTVLAALKEDEYISETDLMKNYGKGVRACIRALEKLDLCVSEERFECKINEKNEKYAVLSDSEEVVASLSKAEIKLTAKQQAVFEALLHYESPCPVTELCEISGAGVSVVSELVKKGVINLVSMWEDRNKLLLKDYSGKGYDGEFELSQRQNEALETLTGLYNSEKAAAALLHGVTGSGKTNVIIKLIQRVLNDGKTVIVLVPEIALTGQTVGRFSAVFGEKIALIHSGLSAGERMDAHKAIIEERAKIVIGTRSAIFAPLKNLGLVVVDEEQESSFKSDKSPKYHARDIARFRCAYNNALLLLASATPSIDSYYKAVTGKYTLVSLTERFSGASLPEVLFHDMRNEPYFELESEDETDKTAGGIPTTIGSTLEAELADNLVKGEQSILFINRRGYRSFAQCHSCGHTFQCPNCSVTLTHHRNKIYGKDTMTCHYCGYSMPIPEECPVCKKNESIVYMGAGTQLLESQLTKMFPNIRVLRMDADTTSGKFSHEEILEKFRNGEADVLVGTQMVAKGHDFPNVSLVGVINADISLYMNDFRANEKTFSLLTQVLGRSGRGEKRGRAVIQTYSPDNDVLMLSSKQDYKEFYEREIQFRRASVFPPFCDIITVTFSGEVERDVQNAVKEFGKGLDEAAKTRYSDVKFILYGPFRNEIYKISGRYRMRFIIKCKNNPALRKMLSELLIQYMSGIKNVSISADVNPVNL